MNKIKVSLIFFLLIAVTQGAVGANVILVNKYKEPLVVVKERKKKRGGMLKRSVSVRRTKSSIEPGQALLIKPEFTSILVVPKSWTSKSRKFHHLVEDQYPVLNTKKFKKNKIYLIIVNNIKRHLIPTHLLMGRGGTVKADVIELSEKFFKQSEKNIRLIFDILKKIKKIDILKDPVTLRILEMIFNAQFGKTMDEVLKDLNIGEKGAKSYLYNEILRRIFRYPFNKTRMSRTLLANRLINWQIDMLSKGKSHKEVDKAIKRYFISLNKRKLEKEYPKIELIDLEKFEEKQIRLARFGGYFVSPVEKIKEIARKELEQSFAAIFGKRIDLILDDLMILPDDRDRVRYLIFKEMVFKPFRYPENKPVMARTLLANRIIDWYIDILSKDRTSQEADRMIQEYMSKLDKEHLRGEYPKIEFIEVRRVDEKAEKEQAKQMRRFIKGKKKEEIKKKE